MMWSRQGMRRFDGGATLSRRALLSAAALGLTSAARPGRAADLSGVSDWSTSVHARVRLIDAGPASPGQPDDGKRLAGIEVQLDSQYLTYWRSPGEAGVAPVAVFDGSTNVADATLLYPAPRRFEEDGTEAIGYKQGVVFPLVVTATDHGKPVTLALTLSFAVCERQCLPVEAKATLLLDGEGKTPEAGLVQAAKAAIPVERAVGQVEGSLVITSVERASDPNVITVLAKTTDNDVPLLFAEAPDPWFVQASGGLWMNDGTIKFAVKVLAQPADPAPLPLRLTLVGVEKAIDVALSLDAPAHKP